MRLRGSSTVVVILVVFFLWASAVRADQVGSGWLRIHMKTSLAEDEAQICAVPNVAWTAVKAGPTICRRG